MADLYDRLEEIQDMTGILTADVVGLRPLLGDRSMQAEVSEKEETNRRFYVRAILALIEALVEQHKRLLLDLAQRSAITLGRGVREALCERLYVVKDNGAVVERDQYLQLQRKLRAVYRAAGEAFGYPLAVTFKDRGWASFQSAVKVRDRITHPKTFHDCQVDENALDTVDRAHEWFKGLNNEFVKVARLHRSQHNW